jgi:protein phosphatase
MQACPHCQFMNPDDNRFCQNCGGALAEELSSTNSLSSSSSDPDIGDLDIASVPTPTTVNRYALLSGAVSQLAGQQFLDDQHRYKLIADLSPADLSPADLPAADNTQIEAIAIDSQPLQPPLLNEFYPEQIGHPSAPTPELKRSLPDAAQPYLELQKQYPFLPPLPKIHDAWEQDGLSVVLLEERSHFPSLLSVWGGQALLVEVIDWLDEMIELWVALQPQNCCRSLLELDNLRIDDDGLLCLQRLYEDDAQPPKLTDLGATWQTLFSQSQRTQRGDLAQLFYDVQFGAVESIEELRSRLTDIAAAVNDSDAPSLEQPTLPALINLGTLPDWDEDLDDSQELTCNISDYSPVALPMQLVGFEDAGLTNIGSQRDHNEDYFSLRSDIKKIESPQSKTLQIQGLYVLCDGMGGHEGGEVASALAVETLKTYFDENWQDQLPSEDQIGEAIEQANRAIFDLNQERASSGSGRMGTTLAMALLQNNKLAIAHVGDSRIYRFSARKGLEQITVDHEVGQREIQRGVQEAIAYARPDAYQLTQALGPRDENGIKPDISFLELNEDVLLLLCSDGLTDNDLLETYWESHLTPMLSGQMSLDIGVNHLIELANQYNGHDNITAIAIRLRFMSPLIQSLPPSEV